LFDHIKDVCTLLAALDLRISMAIGQKSTFLFKEKYLDDFFDSNVKQRKSCTSK